MSDYKQVQILVKCTPEDGKIVPTLPFARGFGPMSLEQVWEVVGKLETLFEGVPSDMDIEGILAVRKHVEFCESEYLRERGWTQHPTYPELWTKVGLEKNPGVDPFFRPSKEGLKAGDRDTTGYIPRNQAVSFESDGKA